MRRLHFYFIMIFAVLFILSCNRGTSKMPFSVTADGVSSEYARDSREAFKHFSRIIPSDASLSAFFASYGATAESIVKLKAMNLVDAREIDGALTDLGHHYQINPADLRSYHEAGLDTRGSAALVLYNGSIVLLADVRDKEKFEAFVDNFISEEFGRPRVHNAKIDDKEVKRIYVMQKDMATLLYIDSSAMIVLGNAATGTPNDSLQTAESYLKQLQKSSLEQNPHFAHFVRSHQNAALSVFFAQAHMLSESIVRNASARKLLSRLLKTAGLGIHFDDDNLHVRLSVPDHKDLRISSDAFRKQGFDRDLAEKFLSTSPVHVAKISAAPDAVEQAVLSFADPENAAFWNESLKKLSIRQLGLDVRSQIFENLSGDIFIGGYGFDDNALPRIANDDPVAVAESWALITRFADPDLSNAFFGKIGLLSSFVGKNRIASERNEDLLILRISAVPGLKLVVAYQNGILAVTSEKIWESKIKTIFGDNVKAKTEPELIVNPKNEIALHIQVADFANLFAAVYDNVAVQIKKFSEPVEAVTLTESVEDKSRHFDLTVLPRKKGE